jgi:abequosyltransferase
LKTPSLSICIPTYNFGRFIGDTLASIIPQATDKLEIVVLDGASTDNTREVVEGYRKIFPRLRYACLEHRGGIDRDIARMVDLSEGDYCWLFSADDTIGENAIHKALEQIKSGCDVYLLGLTVCTFNMKPLCQHPILDHQVDTVFDLKDPRERADYFRHARTSTAFFSYMSSLIVDRSRWIDTEGDESFVGSCWGHVARIFRMIPKGLRVKYLPESYLYNRSGNDSFLENGLVNRISIAVNGYNRLADTFFGHNSEEAFHIRRVIKNEYILRELLSAKLWAHTQGRACDVQLLDVLVDKLFSDRSVQDTFKHMIYRAAPKTCLAIVRKALDTIRAMAKQA